MKINLIITLAALLLLNFNLFACDMIALAGSISSENRQYATDFLISHSGSRTNNDGYGVSWFAGDWENIYKSGLRRWYGDGDSEPLTQIADWDIGSSEPEILLLHARNATTGRGNHPFLLEIEGDDWAFMHNGKITAKLSAYMLEALGDVWFEIHPSNWALDAEGIIDSEVFFHFLMSRYSSGISFEDTLADLAFLERNQSEKSILNFILSNGSELYAYKNSARKSTSHRLSWKLAKGCLIVQTDRLLGKMLETGELLLYNDGNTTSKFINIK